jgi:hypothetical protein
MVGMIYGTKLFIIIFSLITSTCLGASTEPFQSFVLSPIVIENIPSQWTVISTSKLQDFGGLEVQVIVVPISLGVGQHQSGQQEILCHFSTMF